MTNDAVPAQLPEKQGETVTERIVWLIEATNGPVTVVRHAFGAKAWIVTAGHRTYEGQSLLDGLAAAVRGVYGRQTMPPLPPGCEPIEEEGW